MTRAAGGMSEGSWGSGNAADVGGDLGGVREVSGFRRGSTAMELSARETWEKRDTLDFLSYGCDRLDQRLWRF